MRILRRVLIIASSLLLFSTGIMWARSQSTWDTLYVRTGRWFWHIDSAVGKLTIEQSRGWPGAPSYHYRVTDPDPLKVVTPVFAWRIAGAHRVEWEYGPFAGAHGTLCVVLRRDGSVDWDSPAFPVLNSIATVKFSPPFSFWSLTIPYWFVVILCSLSPGGRVVMLIRRRVARRFRQSRGLCPHCGYDLRFSPSRCPECGSGKGSERQGVNGTTSG